MHEIQLRKSIAASTSYLTKDWQEQCGLNERTPKRRDGNARSQVRAELEALIAHAYNLTSSDYAIILDTFPVLKNKELNEYGEYKTKRKCLEEYNRIEKIISSI